MTTQVEAELIAQMIVSDDVRQRDRGVIAKWLSENTDVSDVFDAVEQLIKMQGDAGLWTFLSSDVKGWYVIGSKSQS